MSVPAAGCMICRPDTHYAASGNQSLMRRCRVLSGLHPLLTRRPDSVPVPHPVINADAMPSRLIRPTVIADRRPDRLRAGLVITPDDAVASYQASQHCRPVGRITSPPSQSSTITFPLTSTITFSIRHHPPFTPTQNFPPFPSPHHT